MVEERFAQVSDPGEIQEAEIKEKSWYDQKVDMIKNIPHTVDVNAVAASLKM